MFSPAKKILCLCLFTWFAAQSLASEEVNVHDNSRISIFLQPGVSFLGFDQREYFQDALDTIYHEFLAQALDKKDTQNVAKQDFQKVNFCFPLYAGLQFQLRQDHFVSVGAGYIYDNESVVVSDQNNRSHNYSYTIQGFPLFLEYRFAIPVNLMTLSNESLFSIALRWYWALPHTEIYTSWGKLSAETSYYGAGFGFSIGYLLFNWKSMYVFGDLGYSSISVKSKKQYADIVPNGPEKKAKWNIGGIQLQIRVSFGVWNKPVVEQDSTAQDSAAASAIRDSASANVQSGNSSTKDSANLAKDAATANTAPEAVPTAADGTEKAPAQKNESAHTPAATTPKAEERPKATGKENETPQKTE